jgi:hypothetical protein
MTLKMRRFGTALAFALLAGCDSNPEGPRVPLDARLKTPADGRGEPEQPERKPVTKNRREIVNPE